MLSNRVLVLTAYFLCALAVLGSFLRIIQSAVTGTLGPDLVSIVSDIVWELGPILFVAIGALIVSRQPRNLIGWLLMTPALVSVVDWVITNIIRSVQVPPANPSFWLVLVVWASNASWLFVIFPVLFIAMLFPTGKPVSRRWRWVVWLGVLWMLVFLVGSLMFDEVGPDAATYGVDWMIRNPIGFIPTAVGEAVLIVWIAGLGILTVFAAISLVVRYRRAGAVEREQIKWLAFACGLFAAVYVPALALLGDNNPLALVLGLALLTIPVAIGIAILRYRLWDIDVIIRRTLTYAIVTGVLAIVFFASVVLLQQLFAGITGSGTNELVTVISTLAIAALFVPVRNVIQTAIDRRFNRKKYDAQKVLEHFSQTVRDETDLEKLTGELVNVVQETMQPKSVQLWLKPGKNSPTRRA
jgi:hypothetical protein